MKLQIVPFKNLTPGQLYKILKLRYEVFVKEQQCIYDEFDGHDLHAIHLFMEENNEIHAYCRVFKISEETAVLGRVIVDLQHRARGLGKEIVRNGIEYIRSNWKGMEIKISAQIYLKKFYADFGFKQTSDVYDDAGILHIDMILDNTKREA